MSNNQQKTKKLPGRKLVVGEVEYFFKVGTQNVTIRSEKVSVTVSWSELNSDLSYNSRSITPKMIKAYIVDKILVGQDQVKHKLIEEVSALQNEEQSQLRSKATIEKYLSDVNLKLEKTRKDLQLKTTELNKITNS